MTKRKRPGKPSRKELAYHLAPVGFGVHSAHMTGPPEKTKKQWIVEDGHDADFPRRMIVFLNALKLLGPPEKIKKQLASVRRAIITNERIHRALPSFGTKQAQEKTKNRLIVLRGVLMRYVVMNEQIIIIGWRVHPATGKLTRITKGRGIDLLSEYVWYLYQGKYQDRGNTPKTRRQIAADLKEIFTAEHFDPKPGGGHLPGDPQSKRTLLGRLFVKLFPRPANPRPSCL